MSWVSVGLKDKNFELLRVWMRKGHGEVSFFRIKFQVLYEKQLTIKITLSLFYSEIWITLTFGIEAKSFRFFNMSADKRFDRLLIIVASISSNSLGIIIE